MRLAAIALSIACSLAAACAMTRDASSRRPLTACARDLVEHGYLSEDETAIADQYCRTYTTEQLDCAKREHKLGESPRFTVSPACQGAESPAVARHADGVVAPAASEAKPLVEPALPALASPSTAAAAVSSTEPPPPGDVMVVAAEDSDISTFVRLLGEAGMANDIAQASTVTLLAPTNAVLAKLPKLAKLATNKEWLKKFLSMHVVMAPVSAIDAPEAPTPPTRLLTLAGKVLPMRVKSGAVLIGRAKVVRADVPAANGGIEVIDSVLLP